MGLEQDFISHLFFHVQAGVAWVNLDRIYRFANPYYLELLGCKAPQGIVGHSIYQLLPEARPFLEPIFQRVASIGEVYHAKNVFCRLPARKEKEAAYLDGKIWPMKDLSGKIDGFLISVVDITDRIEVQSKLEETLAELEEEREKLQQDVQEKEKVMGLLDQSHFDLAANTIELEQANEYKTNLLTDISHELRTPLNIILGYTQLFHDGKFGRLTSQQQEVSGRIVAYCRDLSRLIERLVDLPKTKRWSDPLIHTDISLPEVLGGTVDSLRSLFRKKDIRLRWRRPRKFPTIVSDPVKLRRIFFNLMSNAAKFTSHGTFQISLKDDRKHKQIIVSFSSTGASIASKNTSGIFEDFFHLDGAGALRDEEIGRGLAIIKQLLDAVGGKIEVKNKRGEGPRFIIYLPDRIPGQNDLRLSAA